MQKYSLRCSICDTTQSNNSISNIFCDLNCKALLYCDDVSKNKINPIESIKNSINSISLGEGNTPLVKLEKIGEKLGLDKLFAKLEFMSPTGSFKDRGSALVMNVAKNEKVKEFVEDSSGNAGASLSAYAAAANIKAHIWDLPLDDESYDFILCTHVLEHIIDDKKAMQELYRVLKKDGIGIFQVPINLSNKKTYEDFTITDPKERNKAFGQYDHVRTYGMDFFDRLEEAGFMVEKCEYTSKFTSEEIIKYCLPNHEIIPICRK